MQIGQLEAILILLRTDGDLDQSDDDIELEKWLNFGDIIKVYEWNLLSKAIGI